MRHPIAAVKITTLTVTTARERARQVGELFGLDTLQRTRFVTAISEIARHTAQNGSEASLSFMFDTQPRGRRSQCLVAEFADRSPAVPRPRDRAEVMFAMRAETQRGIAAARRLVDHLSVDSPEEGGTVVVLEMGLPRDRKPLSIQEVEARVTQLAGFEALTPFEELERLNGEMALAMEELRGKQLALEQADLRKNEFMAMLAHELRNPLAAIKLNLALLKLKPMTTGPELADRREVMSRQVDQISRMVSDLVDVTRVENGKVELQETAVEVNSLVKDALEMAAAAIQERKHDVVFKAASHDLWLNGDSARLLQVFTNVIQNAAKYTPERGRIQVAVRAQDAQAVIEVSDNGVGIAADMLPHVFALFVQARDKSPDASAGMGVGLTLADRLVREHGGTISVHSEGVGRGSQFTIKLPLMSEASGFQSLPLM
ncbi:sensor histidine kinase [Caenimonas soli]|uniref:sensor histidine kinase n=1 Tax=Caenimonas soli TaxID=2735555 RepID=UPI0015544567|nr:sensor histidine kinase [Caenimonas soli]NPC56811.1 sensor histidine kinase [Caenimonas soli]